MTDEANVSQKTVDIGSVFAPVDGSTRFVRYTALFRSMAYNKNNPICLTLPAIMTIKFKSLRTSIWKALSMPGNTRGGCFPGLSRDKEYRPSSAPRRTNCKNNVKYKSVKLKQRKQPKEKI